MLTNEELNQVVPMSGLFGLGQWAALYGLKLARSVSVEEVLDASRRLRARQPSDPSPTYGSLTRKTW